MSFGLKARISGEYEILKGASLDNQEVVTRFPNLITDLGMDNMTTRNVVAAVALGSGATAPQFTDTGLVNEIARKNAGTSGNYFNDAIIQTEGVATLRGRFTIVFNPGEATGNLSEIGAGWVVNGVTQLFSRARIKDQNGEPTTITKLENEYLTVNYYVTVVYDTTDQVSTMNIKGIDRTVTVRWANLSSTNAVFSHSYGLLTGSVQMSSSSMYNASSDLGTINSNPSGSDIKDTSREMLPKGAGENFRVGRSTFDENRNTSDSRIGCVIFMPIGSTPMRMQVKFDPPLEKDNTEKFEIEFVYSWERG